MKSPFSVPGQGQGQGQGMKLDRYEWKKLLLDASPGRSEPAEYRVPSTRVSRLRPSASFFCRFLRASISCTNFGDHVGPASRSVSVEAGVNTAVGARRRDTLKSLTHRTGQRSANSRSSLCERVHTDRPDEGPGVLSVCVILGRTFVSFRGTEGRERKRRPGR